MSTINLNNSHEVREYIAELKIAHQKLNYNSINAQIIRKEIDLMKSYLTTESVDYDSLGNPTNEAW